MSEIVGVVEDGKYETLTEGPRLAYFIPILQRYSSTIVLVARSRRNDLGLAGAMRQAVENLDPQLPVYGVGSLRQMLGAVYLPMHAAAIALGAFGVLASMLSVTGIYGLAAYTVSRRTREIGIRMAIGARPSHVLRLVSDVPAYWFPAVRRLDSSSARRPRSCSRASSIKPARAIQWF